mmetsp:Transcript_7077/g.43611  ORF Transcript_7077/g.43611 Transcript_7077/m.43611 type:complete len:244 (+) Transcript_7077:786-1517(+)
MAVQDVARSQEGVLARLKKVEVAMMQVETTRRTEDMERRMAALKNEGNEADRRRVEVHGTVAVKLAEELRTRNVRDFSFHRVTEDYYEQTLEQRGQQLGARRVEQLCKSIVLENTQAGDDVKGCADPRNSKYYLVVVQYCKRFNAELIRSFVYAMNKDKGVSKRKFNFRLCPEEVSHALTGYGHNAVTPIGMEESIPIILSKSVAELVEGCFWLGAGEVDLKLGLNTQQFIKAYDPFICDCTF